MLWCVLDVTIYIGLPKRMACDIYEFRSGKTVLILAAISQAFAKPHALIYTGIIYIHSRASG